MNAWEAIFSAWMPNPGGDPAYRAAMESVVREEADLLRRGGSIPLAGRPVGRLRPPGSSRAALRLPQRFSAGDPADGAGCAIEKTSLRNRMGPAGKTITALFLKMR